MIRPATARRSARSRAAAIVCAGVACAVASGCLDTVSLGSGVGEGGHGGADGALPRLRFPANGETDEEVSVGGLDCHPGLTTDLDGDGWTPALGDCNDCDPDTGPSAAEMPTASGDTPMDEDCDGFVDEANAVCDVDLAVDDSSALSAARALDLCEVASAGRWGVVHAVWVLPDGTTPPLGESFALGHGLVDRFGPNVSGAPIGSGTRYEMAAPMKCVASARRAAQTPAITSAIIAPRRARDMTANLGAIIELRRARDMTANPAPSSRPGALAT